MRRVSDEIGDPVNFVTNWSDPKAVRIKGRGLPGGTSDRQHHARGDARCGRGQDDLGDGLPLRRAQRVATVFQLERHQFQHLLARPDDDGHHDEGESGRAHHSPVAELDHQSRVDEDADEDGRHSGHHVGKETDQLRQPVLLAVLDEIDGPENPQGHRNDRGKPDHDGGAYQTVQKPAPGRGVAEGQGLGQKAPAHGRQALCWRSGPRSARPG